MLNEVATDVSIIICTRNRAAQLRETLRSIGQAEVPTGWTVELILVDNGSTDETRQVIREAELPVFELSVVEESTPGVSHAKNTGVRKASGQVLLFTDDDVRVPEDWIVGMAQPIRTGRADAVAGAVTLAPHLRRPWQRNGWITSPLATTDAIRADDPQRLVGANMAISRRVFEVVPSFDPLLGPGSDLGLGEETLLTHQMKSQGFAIVSAFDTVVEHHCSPSRLSRQSYLGYAEKIGRSQGYIDYHWKHTDVHRAKLITELIIRYGKLFAYRMFRKSEIGQEGMPTWEMVLLTQVYHRRQLLSEVNRPRRYSPSTG